MVGLGLLAVGIVAGGLTVYNATERTRDCTVESIATVQVRRDPNYRVLTTAECGDLRTETTAVITVVDPDCQWNNLKLGSTYRITTKGLDGFFFHATRPVIQGPLVLVSAPADAGCSSDSWLIED